MEDIMLIGTVISLIFFIIGGIFLFIALRISRPIKTWEMTKGIIIKKETNINVTLGKLIRSDELLSKSPDYYPTVRYTVDGSSYEYTSNIHQSPGIPIGKQVTVLYNPDNPNEAIINTFIQRASIFIVLGSVFLIIGLVFASISGVMRLINILQ